MTGVGTLALLLYAYDWLRSWARKYEGKVRDFRLPDDEESDADGLA